MPTVVVTGASRGLGRYCAERLAALGHRVIGLARTGPADAPFEMRACNVGDAASVKDSLADLRRSTDVLALVNAAGIASMNLLVTTPVSTIQRIVEVNLLGTIYCCQAVAPALIRSGGGRIVNFSTIAVALGLAGESVYAASKAGVEGFSRAFAREMAGFNVTVNVIAPGPIDTELIAKVPREKIQAIIDRQIVPVQATPEDLWNVVSLLLSPEGRMISGQVLHLGGA
jgi:3-oxoacyl-[acyl-carrier protein] reductase